MLETWIWGGAGLLAGAGITSLAWFIRQNTLKNLLSQSEFREQQASTSAAQHISQLEQLRHEYQQLSQTHSDAHARNQANEAELRQLLQHQSRLQQWWQAEKRDREALGEQLSTLNSEYSALKSSLEEKTNNFKEQQQAFEKQKELMKEEFQNLANEILEQKGRSFSEQSQKNLSNLLNPIQNEMKGFREKVEHIHERESEQRIALRTELRNMQLLNQAITDQAEKLTTALQGQKKVQGNWGELMLENVLDNAGLRPGEDYQREVSFTTSEGRQRPDAIVYLPQHKHLIIDAKTSLAAYTRYVNAEEEGERLQALREHSQAVGDRIKELADRDYYRLPGLNSPEVVIMFIPVESAYVEALKYDESLYQRAIEHNVLVATPTTLLTSLNIVRQLWRFEDQSKHTAELAKRAERFYTKLNSFLTSMQGVGKKLDDAQESYEKAMGQLYLGRGNLIKQAAEFKELGVSVQKELPEPLTEKARLELENSATQKLN